MIRCHEIFLRVLSGVVSLYQLCCLRSRIVAKKFLSDVRDWIIESPFFPMILPKQPKVHTFREILENLMYDFKSSDSLRSEFLREITCVGSGVSCRDVVAGRRHRKSFSCEGFSPSLLLHLCLCMYAFICLRFLLLSTLGKAVCLIQWLAISF